VKLTQNDRQKDPRPTRASTHMQSQALPLLRMCLCKTHLSPPSQLRPQPQRCVLSQQRQRCAAPWCAEHALCLQRMQITSSSSHSVPPPPPTHTQTHTHTGTALPRSPDTGLGAAAAPLGVLLRQNAAHRQNEQPYVNTHRDAQPSEACTAHTTLTTHGVRQAACASQRPAATT
jgi:hypothetical protein